MSKKEENNNQQLIAVNGQYVKDLSFESPQMPITIGQSASGPKIDISLNLEAKHLKDSLYEVCIEINVKANHEDKPLFIIELSYAGLFTIQNFNDEQKELILLIHCPTILFPFARRIIADITRDGGFQPLLIDPVDFNMLYRQRVEQQKAVSNGNGKDKSQ